MAEQERHRKLLQEQADAKAEKRRERRKKRSQKKRVEKLLGKGSKASSKSKKTISMALVGEELLRNVVEDVPEHFVDPITLEMMKEPVISKYGHTFDRSSIERMLDAEGPSKGKCPLTRQPLSKQDLFPNRALADAIQSWRELKAKAKNEAGMRVDNL